MKFTILTSLGYNSAALSTFTVLYISHHNYPFAELFIIPNRNSVPIKQKPTFLRVPRPLVISILLSVSELGQSRYLTYVESHSICHSVSGLCHLAWCFQVICTIKCIGTLFLFKTIFHYVAVPHLLTHSSSVSTFWLLCIMPLKIYIQDFVWTYAHVFNSLR